MREQRALLEMMNIRTPCCCAFVPQCPRDTMLMRNRLLRYHSAPVLRVGVAVACGECAGGAASRCRL